MLLSALICMLCLPVIPCSALDMNDGEVRRFWDSVEDLERIIPRGATPSVEVRLREEGAERLEVPYWQDSVVLHLEIGHCQDLESFSATLAYSTECFRIPDDDFHQPGKLWKEWGETLLGEIRPPMIAWAPQEGRVTIIGPEVNVRTGEGLSGEGVLAEVRFVPKGPGSGFVRIEDFWWTQAGGKRGYGIWGRDEARVQVVYEQPIAYLSFDPPDPSAESPAGGSQSRKVPPGKPAIVYLCVANLYRALGIRFDLDFDREKLTLIGMEEGDLFRREGLTLCCFDTPRRTNRTGELKDQGIALLDPVEGVRGGGWVARFFFLPEGSSPGWIRLGRVETSMALPEGKDSREEINRLQTSSMLSIARNGSGSVNSGPGESGL